MSQTTQAYNPFQMLIEPEVILAAVEKSERLGQLNRHLCRPLDRPVLGSRGTAEAEAAAEDGVEGLEDNGAEDAAAL